MSLIPNVFGRRSSVFDPFSLDVWDPFEPFSSLIPAREAAASNAAKERVAAVASARIDWKETPEAHIFKADLPGLKKDEVKIELEEGCVLQISGERKREEEEKNERWHRVECSHGKFVRRFRLPGNAKVDEIKAAMDNGVLTITVPRKPQPEPDIKEIQISAA